MTGKAKTKEQSPLWIPTVKELEQVVKQPDKLLTINENATVAQAAKKMTDNHIGCLVVFNSHDKFTGVITERDMLAKVLANSIAPDKALVKNIMTTTVISCNPDSTIDQVEKLMSENKIRHVPIVKKNAPIGMVSSRDTIAHHLSKSKTMKDAAEQLAMLPTGLKTLDFDDVIQLAINQVPKSFAAQRAVLCLPQKDSSAPLLYRKDCPVSEKRFLKSNKIKKLSQNGQIFYGEICRCCAASGARPPQLIIPLMLHDQSTEPDPKKPTTHGFLCMCGLDQSSCASQELQLYKASLLRELLSANLTNAKLYQNYRQARQDSETDPLTRLGTRRVLERVLKAECARAERYNRPFSIAIVDMDNFKEINDTQGHAVGDMALQELAKLMHHNVRTADMAITRFGGDEFVLLLPETKIDEATVLLERLRSQVKTIKTPHLQTITISCGLAEWSPGPPPDTAETIMSRADKALYTAKKTGRDKVVANKSV